VGRPAGRDLLSASTKPPLITSFFRSAEIEERRPKPRTQERPPWLFSKSDRNKVVFDLEPTFVFQFADPLRRETFLLRRGPAMHKISIAAFALALSVGISKIEAEHGRWKGEGTRLPVGQASNPVRAARPLRAMLPANFSNGCIANPLPAQ
jgi:hypothetical protein